MAVPGSPALHLPRSTSGRAALGGIAFLLLLLVGWVLVPKAVEVDAATKRDVLETLVVNARVYSRTKAEIASPVAGTVVEVPVREGDAVRRGQLLVRLDDREEIAALAQARAAESQAAARRADLEKSRGPVSRETRRQAEIALEQAEQDFKRQTSLRAEGFLSDSDMEVARRSLETARSRVVSARLQEGALAPGGTEERAALQALAEAKAAAEAAEARRERRRIVSPADGTVLSRAVDPGDVASVGKTLLVLAPAEKTLLLAQPDEKNLAVVRVGQPALASADAFPGKSFPARVEWVAPGVDEARGTVDVRLSVEEPPPYLKTDMTLSVEIETARRAGALAVPAPSVRDAAKSPWLLVVRGGRAVRQDVKLGARGTRFVEVLEGLSEGDLVVRAAAASGASSAAKVAPGDRVRPRRP